MCDVLLPLGVNPTAVKYISNAMKMKKKKKLGASNFWKLQSLFRPVQGLFYLLTEVPICAHVAL
jgi:hypothetical protein